MALEFTLHSTMFSINLEAIDQRCVPDVLYIPLCFLLINLEQESNSLRYNLYIPLCFLLIGYYKLLSDYYYTFTFHYVFY